MTAALEGGEWSAARPGRNLPPGKTRYTLSRRLGGPQGRSGKAENPIPTGIRSRTVEPVVSRYTDWATINYCIYIYSSRSLRHVSAGNCYYNRMMLHFNKTEGLRQRPLRQLRCFINHKINDRKIDWTITTGWGYLILKKKQYFDMKIYRFT